MHAKYGLKRIIEKSVYSSARAVYGLSATKYFNIGVSGLEKLPEGSAVLAFNHTFGLDGIFTCVGFPRQIHHLIQFEGVYNRSPYNQLCLWALGFIPVSVGVLDENKKVKIKSINEIMNTHALKRSEDYLRTYRDFVGIFIDGPASRLLDEANTPIQKEQRIASGSAAHIAIASNKPLVPVGTFMPEDLGKRLWEFGYDKHKKNIRYLENRKRKLIKQGCEYLIPYEINIGEPIYPDELEGNISQKRKRLTELVKAEIVRLSKNQNG